MGVLIYSVIDLCWNDCDISVCVYLGLTLWCLIVKSAKHGSEPALTEPRYKGNTGVVTFYYMHCLSWFINFALVCFFPQVWHVTYLADFDLAGVCFVWCGALCVACFCTLFFIVNTSTSFLFSPCSCSRLLSSDCLAMLTAFWRNTTTT